MWKNAVLSYRPISLLACFQKSSEISFSCRDVSIFVKIFISSRLKLIQYLRHSTTQAEQILETKNKYLEIKTRHKRMHSSITAFNSPHAFHTRLSSLNPGPEALFAEVTFMSPRVAHTWIPFVLLPFNFTKFTIAATFLYSNIVLSLKGTGLLWPSAVGEFRV